MFRIEIATDNDAFEGDPGEEIARILSVLAVKLRTGHVAVTQDQATGPLADINGNTVGQWQYISDRA